MNNDPSGVLIAVTPSDTVDIRGGMRTRGIYVGVGGNISVVGDSGAVTLVGVPTGSVLPIRISRVNSTDTTATDIVALY